MIKQIDIHELMTLLEDNKVQLLDVRTQEELDVSSLEVTHIPLHQLEHKLENLDKSVAWAVICRSGARSAQATMILQDHGFEAMNVTGGMKAYQKEIDPSITVG